MVRDRLDHQVVLKALWSRNAVRDPHANQSLQRISHLRAGDAIAPSLSFMLKVSMHAISHLHAGDSTAPLPRKHEQGICSSSYWSLCCG